MRKDEFPIVEEYAKNEIKVVLKKIKVEIERYADECKSDNAECNQCNDVTFKSIIAIIESEEKKYD